MTRKISGLYAVTPDRAETDELARQVEAAVRGGARFVQYRNKSAPPSLRLSQATRVAVVCAGAGARMIVNDDARIARDAGADGVHLGRGDGTVDGARRLLGPDKLIGVSCYNELERAREAVEQGADYIAFGSFFASFTKPGAVRATLDLLHQAKHELLAPVVAIGGIDANNAGVLVRAGADSVAVARAVFDAPDIEDAARRISALFASPPFQETLQ
jgi:thiamine-phosphate pyrophosphorylase